MTVIPYKSNEKDRPILDDITARLRQSLDRWYGVGSCLDSGGPEFRSYRNCFILRYPLTASSAERKTILVKIRRKPKMDALWQAIDADIHMNIPNEYGSLQSVYGYFVDKTGDLDVIRPLAYFEQYHAIVMEEYPSRTLRQILIKQRSSHNGTGLKELVDAATKTGKWLHYFHHKIHTPVDTPYTRQDILNLVENYAALLQNFSHARVQATSISDAFSRKLENAQIHSILFSQSHADMTCDNVLYSNDKKVCIIDIKTRPAPIYSDLGLILTHPETFKMQIFSAGTYLPETLLKEYRQAILAGYFGDDRKNEFFVQLFSAIKILDKWTMYEELMSKYRGMKFLLSIPVGPYVTAYFRNILTKHLDSIDTQEIGQSLGMAKPTAL